MLIPPQQASESLRNNSPTPRPPSLLSHDPKLVTKPFEIPESSEYRQDHRSRAGTLFESYSSDSDTLSEVTANQPSVVPQPLFSRNVPRFDGKGINILTSNALGLEFLFEGVVLDAQTVAPANSQVESLRTPPIHQDTRSYELLNQKYQEQDEHLVPWFESPANEMLAGGCPRDICLRADASDASGLKVSRYNREAVPVDEKCTADVPTPHSIARGRGGAGR